MPSVKKKFNIKDKSEDCYVAYIDVMGFSELVNQNNLDNLDSYFSKVTDELEKIQNEEKFKGRIQSFLISDSIILLAPKGVGGLRLIIKVIRRIQNALLWRKILIRGAIAYGPVYYNPDKNIIVGKSFIKAYHLEKEAKFPRVILDPSIIQSVFIQDAEQKDRRAFLKLINKSENYNFEKREIYIKSEYSEIVEDGIFLDYANKVIQETEISGNLKYVYETIKSNFYSDQKLYTKYVWLRDYFLEIMKLTVQSTTLETVEKRTHAKKVNEWIDKFEGL